MTTDRLHLSPKHRAEIEALLREYLPGVEVWAYGSRVNRRSHDGSDLDLVLRGPDLQEIPTCQLGDFLDAVRDSTIPFLVEARDWAHLPERFHREIERGHVVIVEKEERVTGGEWQEVALGDLVEIYDGPHATPKKADAGPIFLGISNLASGRLDLEKTEHLSEEDYMRWTHRVTPRPGDVVFSYETRLGEAAFIPTGLRCCLGRRMGLLRPKGGMVDARFLLYVFLGTRFQETLRSRTIHGSTVDRIPLTEMGSFPIEVPRNIDEQRAIAHILGTLDDKIELNRRMNETLEAMARALFKSWFVDFDPVRAKMEGRDTGLPKHLAGLFPDRFEESELGEIPAGWMVRRLGDLCHKPQYGYTASAKSEPVGPRFLRITDINKESWVSWSRVPYCEATDEDLLRYRLSKGEVLIARMADPGHGILVEEDVEAIFASYLIRFKPIESRHARLLQYWLKSDAYWQLVKGQAGGTTRVSLNAKVLIMFPLVVPPDAVASAFAAVVGALRDRLVKSTTEMQSLAAMRDLLLPSLISGKLRV